MIRARGPPGSRRPSRLLAIGVLAAMLVLAGCSANTGGDGATATPSFSAEDASGEALAAIEALEEYRYESNGTFVRTVNNVDQQFTLDVSSRVDRPEREVRVAQTVEARGQTVRSDVYVVNGTLYERSDRYVSAYSSEWVKVDVSENISGIMRQYDPLRLYREVLANGTARANRTARMDGRETYVLDVRANESSLGSYSTPLQGDVTPERVDVTVWIDAETGNVARIAGNVSQEVSARGRTAQVDATVDLAFSYDEPVDVTLPEAAADAVDLTNRTG